MDMAYSILVVEDNKQILNAVSLFLQMNDYKTYNALNGKEALDILAKLDLAPDLVLSDIMMPVMNGYDFYQKFIENPQWAHVPFIFLTAKSDPDDIRFGKMLGVDDYITKPFNEEDLLASIQGKIKRSKRNEEISNALSKKFCELKGSSCHPEQTIPLPSPESIYAFSVFWDDIRGPKFVQSHPDAKDCPFPIKEISTQLYDVSTGIFGGISKWTQAESALVRVPSVNMDAFIFFDAYESPKMRGGVQTFMLGVIARKIHYLVSSHLRGVSEKYSRMIRKGTEWKVSEFWQDSLAEFKQ